MLHVGPFRREGGIERVSLQHTQQLVLGSLAFMVVFLHWLTKPTKAAAGIGLANETLHRVATRLPQPLRQSGVSTPSATTSIVVFRRRLLNVRSRLR